MSWQATSLIAMLCFSVSLLLFRVIGARVSADVLLAHLFVLGSIAYLVHVTLAGRSLAIPWSWWGLIVAAAAVCYVGNLCQVEALTRAPNPGQALAIINASVVVVALIAVPLFAAPLGGWRLLGIGLCLAGIIVTCLADGSPAAQPG